MHLATGGGALTDDEDVCGRDLAVAEGMITCICTSYLGLQRGFQMSVIGL